MTSIIYNWALSDFRSIVAKWVLSVEIHILKLTLTSEQLLKVVQAMAGSAMQFIGLSESSVTDCQCCYQNKDQSGRRCYLTFILFVCRSDQSRFTLAGTFSLGWTYLASIPPKFPSRWFIPVKSLWISSRLTKPSLEIRNWWLPSEMWRQSDFRDYT